MKRVCGVSVAQPLEHTVVVEQRPCPDAAREHDDIRLVEFVEGGIDLDAEEAVVGPDDAALVPDERDVDHRDALEHLVRADAVEGGKPGEQWDDDVDPAILPWTGWFRRSGSRVVAVSTIEEDQMDASTLKHAAGTVTERLGPVAETVTERLAPVAETVTEKLAPVAETVTERLGEWATPPTASPP